MTASSSTKDQEHWVRVAQIEAQQQADIAATNTENDAKKFQVAVTEHELPSTSGSSAPQVQQDAWETGVMKRMPWLGVCSLIVIILASVGQLLVLIFSDARSATSWPSVIAPNVCLSILNSMATLAITFAVGQGIAIAWWRRALLGASIKELHYTWSFSTSISAIFLKYKYFNVIALAALMTKVAIVDGVLFQRATGTYIAIAWTPAEPGSQGEYNVSAWAQNSFPRTGVMSTSNSTDGETTFEYSITIKSWLDIGSSGINHRDYLVHCSGVGCVYGLNGSGFAIDCKTSTTTDNFVDTVQTNGRTNNTIFSVDWDMLFPDAIKNYSRLVMNAKWPTLVNDSEECATNFTLRSCELRPAILNYTVAYTNVSSIERSRLDDVSWLTNKDNTGLGNSGSQIGYSCQAGSESFAWGTPSGNPEYDSECRLYTETWRQVKGVKVLENHDINELPTAGSNSSLVGIFNAMKDSFTTDAKLNFNNGTWSVTQTGSLAPVMMGPSPIDNTYCNYVYPDPSERVIERLNDLMLQTSQDSGLYPGIQLHDENGDTIYTQKTAAEIFYKDIYYTSDFRYCGAALGLTVLVILCIIPAYWGFWELGRDVTLGPMEIAYAFQGPSFASVHGVNGHVEKVVRSVGRTKVQYGEVPDGEGKRLAFKMA